MKSKRKTVLASLIGATVLGISAYAGYNTYNTFNQVNESDLLLENIEALALDGESASNPYPYFNLHYRCYDPNVGFIGECGCSSEAVTEGGNSKEEHKHSCKKCCS